MFRFIEPLSGQFTNHIEGIFSICVHCRIPNVYKSYCRNMLPDLWIDN